MKWRCLVCGYIHEGETPPDVCPVCGVDSSYFEKIEEEPAAGGSGEIPGAVIYAREENLTPEEAVKKAIRSISYGLFIISSSYGGKDNGQTANTCFQITSEPNQIAIGINKHNYTHELISQSRKFAVAILDRNGSALAKHFGFKSGRNTDKFAGLKAHRGLSGILIPDEVLAAMEAEVVGEIDAGTHTLFLGKVTAGEVLGQGEPMTYAYYRSIK